MNKERPPKLKLLYVEDDINTREEVVTFLQRRNYHLLLADNGRQGLELYLEQKPDIIISDIMMPEMNGLEMIQAVKNDNPAVPTILLTAYSDAICMNEAIELGVDHYVLKPVDLGKLMQAIEKCSKRILERMAIQECQDERGKLITELQGALYRIKILTLEINGPVAVGHNAPQEVGNHKQPSESIFVSGRKVKAQQISDEDFQQRILAQLNKTVLPYLDLLRQEVKTDKSVEYIDLITAHLHSVGESFVQNLSDSNLKLTKREILIADLIRQGKSTIEIANLLGLMSRSVESYRNRIRKKLQLNNQKINLQQYLRSTFTAE